MLREEFVVKVEEVKNTGSVMSESQIRERIHNHANLEKDLPICVGELSELILELTRYQRNKMNREDFLQELSRVQWAIWSLQDNFGVSDEELRAAVQASFRIIKEIFSLRNIRQKRPGKAQGHSKGRVKS